MARKSTKTEFKATDAAIETKVEDIKTEDKAAETKVAEETAAGRKKTSAKKAETKAETKTAETAVKEPKAAKETAVKETKEPKAAKETVAKTAKNTAKKEHVKCSVQLQYAGKAYTQEELLKVAKDIWKSDLKQKAGDLNSVELYVKPEENKVYYVMNDEFKGSFDI